MKNLTIGIMAHVDAGKTTLSEGLLYAAGVLRETGRVDHGDAFLDTYALEKERGITIFSKQAVLPIGTLIDTPGHVDFAPETERVLSVLDYAILVISGADGVQGHTRTLWRLLEKYEVPVFLFINKMDLPGADREQIRSELRTQLAEGCVDFTGADVSMGSEDVSKASLPEETAEAIAMLNETVMESYLEGGEITAGEIRRLTAERKLFPCMFGAALKQEGVAEFYQLLQTCMRECIDESEKGKDFSARVYKITRDEKGTRLTHIRVMSGILTPKQEIEIASGNRKRESESDGGGVIREKVDQIRLYSGSKYELLNEAGPGTVCALTGLRETYPGQGIGGVEDSDMPVLVPVLTYRLILPEETPPVTMLPKLRELEEELPELHIEWEKATEEIRVRVMGKVQTEILQEVIRERYGVQVDFGQAQIVYKETVTKPAHGIGHYEPLRHYAEAHVGIEPLPPGSGIVVDRQVSTDDLDLNWQRLILTHFLEKEHKGVRIGAPITDVKLTVIGGRAHLKHTEGGDFRQATYRAIRHGLMQAECRVLEPYYAFRLVVPTEQVGRAMTDIERMCGHFSLEEGGTDVGGQAGSVITGHAPVVSMQDYAATVSTYTGGQGELSLSFYGYLPCHNEDEVIADFAYDPEKDEEDLPGSIFCAHGAGYYVPWEEVAAKAHVQVDWKP
ncbi:MAG: translation factor GTPase family protein [Eubacterium sp.]|nr:translation factor GTPase family protein [Eubacterium sp.]